MNPSNKGTLAALPRNKISVSAEEDYHSSRLRISPERNDEELLQPEEQQQQCVPQKIETVSKPLHEASKHSSTEVLESSCLSSSDELSQSLRVEEFVPISTIDDSRRSTAAYSNRNSNSSCGSLKLLSFDNDVSVLEFNTVIGDNPGVSDGCPIALGFDLSQRSTASLREMEYEHARRKKTEAKKLSFSDRAKILHNAGFSVKEIATATYETLKAKEERSRTNRKQKWDNMNAWMESMTRKIKKMTT